jgi:enoyl-CoA hydratase/carnithine racemase
MTLENRKFAATDPASRLVAASDYGHTVEQVSSTRSLAVDDRSMVFETLKVRREGAVLFAEIAAPPMNLLGPELVRDLVSLIQRAEADNAIQVLVFMSADPDYFISHVDVTRIKEYRAEATKLTGEASIGILFRHLSASRLVTIAQIEGRVRGAGSEFVLACDMRFAARESAIFAQPEPGLGDPGSRPSAYGKIPTRS